MGYILFLIIAVLNIGNIRSEYVDYTRKNSRMDIFPIHEENGKDISMFSPRSEVSSDHEWNEIESKYQPESYKKMIDLSDNNEYKNEEIDSSEDQFKSIDQLDDEQLIQFSKYLITLLQRPDFFAGPLILIKDNGEDRTLSLEFDGVQGISKRSRYYRRYPWKRQNPRSYNNMEYDPYSACNPTRNDVFQLLVALHDARQGNKSRFVNFCNRRRPASAVYTNIRFLGRRKK